MLSSRRLAFAGLVVAATAALTFQAGAVGARGGAAAPEATAGQGRVLLLYNCERGRYKPRTVIVTCADANFRVRAIQWSSWTANEARGRGTALVNDCDPDCAGGTFRRYPVRLRAFRSEEARLGHEVSWERALEHFAAAYDSTHPWRSWDVRRPWDLSRLVPFGRRRIEHPEPPPPAGPA